jgi:uncharacterized membrane protein
LLFVSAAFIAMSAQLLNFVAIGQGELSAIIPLLNTTPLFAVLFSGLFLRAMETLSTQIFLGALLMVAGVVLITTR